MAQETELIKMLQKDYQFASSSELRQWYEQEVHGKKPVLTQPKHLPDDGTEIITENFENWGKTVCTNSIQAAYPKTKEDVQAIISKVQGTKIKVTCMHL